MCGLELTVRVQVPFNQPELEELPSSLFQTECPGTPCSFSTGILLDAVFVVVISTDTLGHVFIPITFHPIAFGPLPQPVASLKGDIVSWLRAGAQSADSPGSFSY